MIHALVIIAFWTLFLFLVTGRFFVGGLLNRSMMRELASALGARMAGNWLNYYVAYDCQGSEGRIRIRIKLRGRPNELRLELIVPSSLRWTVRPKQLLEDLRILPSFQQLTRIENLGPGFSDLYIVSDDQAQGTAFFAEPNHQAIIFDFFAHGFNTLAANNNVITAEKKICQFSDLEPNLLRRQFEALRQLAA